VDEAFQSPRLFFELGDLLLRTCLLRLQRSENALLLRESRGDRAAALIDDALERGELLLPARQPSPPPAELLSRGLQDVRGPSVGSPSSISAASSSCCASRV